MLIQDMKSNATERKQVVDKMLELAVSVTRGTHAYPSLDVQPYHHISSLGLCLRNDDAH